MNEKFLQRTLKFFWKKYLLKELISFRPSFEVSVGSVLVYVSSFGDRYLLLHYPHGHWDFVKGHKERGEEEKETLLREIEEETGVKSESIVIHPRFRRVICFWYCAKGGEREKRISKGSGIFVFKKVIFYLAESKVSNISLSHEHIGCEWLPFPQAMERLTYENSKRVLFEAEKFRGK